jgi:hypothetical protein
MILTLSNLDKTEISAVVEPFADERQVPQNGTIKLRIDISASADLELIVGNDIISIYIPIGADYVFLDC